MLGLAGESHGHVHRGTLVPGQTMSLMAVNLLQRRFGHVIINTRDVSAQTRRNVRRGRKSNLERGEHIG